MEIEETDGKEVSFAIPIPPPPPPPKPPKPKVPKRPNSLHAKSKTRKAGFAIVCLSALGVVFGDIGTSPLYVYKSIFAETTVNEANVMGVASLIFWAITLVVCIKYLIFVMRADHQREGGVFALLSLILFGSDGGKHNVVSMPVSLSLSPALYSSIPLYSSIIHSLLFFDFTLLLDAVPLKRVESRAHSPSSSMVEFSHIHVEEKKFPHPWVVKRNLRRISTTFRFFIILSMVGSGLLLGDGVITPAISVLSAVEGLEIANASLKPAVLPVTIVILLLLFFVQQFGTGKVGMFFGPVMVLWFITLSGVGIYQIQYNPVVSIFKALSPYYGFMFFKNNGLKGWEALGAVVLCITGCEAMYADMGHFGKNAVRVSWLAAVYPALILNYLGQAAMLIRDPSTISDPFYLFVLGILATIIASQALISGAFSLTQQAVSLASFPRLKIIHTSNKIEGQIYIPAINFLLMVCCILLVIGFRTSDRLASAYGVAVCGDMLLTSLFFLSVAFLRWRWNPFIIAWLAIEFWLTSNLRKVPSGGWFPLLFAAVLVVLMYVWRWGNLLLKSKIYDEQVPVENLVYQMKENQIAVCSGVGVFMSAVSEGIPHVCTQFLKHVPVMHKTAIFVTIHYRHEPFVARTQSKFIPVGDGIFRLVLESGYMETTLNVAHLSEVAQLHNLDIEFSGATYYLGNEIVGPKPTTWTGHKIFVELFNILLQFSHKSTATQFNIPDRNLIYVGGNYLI